MSIYKVVDLYIVNRKQVKICKNGKILLFNLIYFSYDIVINDEIFKKIKQIENI